ncbi:hypothetical protein AG1IA_10453 [Rhizoctonia solani AG-1 IA]|uniref:Uncharacterized protein n=1 Tax=Thanatephorus cucumeris (strain AG1-IA) TaxID=983506 RepID=L8WFM8_THACA|nr:hypothetical protein AG1IA_10453 [Rhizoctonia solani AG-1 IA]
MVSPATPSPGGVAMSGALRIIGCNAAETKPDEATWATTHESRAAIIVYMRRDGLRSRVREQVGEAGKTESSRVLAQVVERL